MANAPVAGSNAFDQYGVYKVLSATDYGVYPTARVTYDVVCNNGAFTITSATAAFTGADVGKTIAIYDTDGAANQVVVTTIASVTNATTAVMAAAATETLTAGRGAMVIGTPQNPATLIAEADALCADWVSGALHPPMTGGRVYVDFPVTEQGTAYLFNAPLVFTGNGIILNGSAQLCFAYALDINERQYGIQGPAGTCIDFLDVNMFGSGPAALLGENSKQSHSFINNFTAWGGSRDFDVAETPPYIAALELRGNNWTIGKVYAHTYSLGLYCKAAGDMTISHPMHMVGCQYGAYFENVNNITGSMICDSLEEKGLLIEGGAHNFKFDVYAFTASEEFDTMDYVVDISPSTTSQSENLDISVTAQRTGGKIIRIAYTKDSKFKLMATNEPNAHFTTHVNGVITQMVEYGSGNSGSLDIHATRDGNIATLFTGTRVGNIISVSDGTISYFGSMGGTVNDAQTSGTQVAISNTVTETTLFTKSITGNAMGSSSSLKCRLHGTYTNNTGGVVNVGFKLKISFGGTTIYQEDGFIASAAATSTIARPWVLDFDITNAGATNLQRMNGMFVMGTAASQTTGIGDLSTGGGIIGAIGYGTTSAVDTTTGQTLLVTATMAQASANLSMTCDGGYCFVARGAIG